MNHPHLRAAGFAVALCSAFALGGCNLASLNATIATDASQTLPTFCSLGATAHAAFATISATGKISATAIANEAASYAGLEALCANPPSDIATSIVSAAQIYAVIVNALSSARNAA